MRILITRTDRMGDVILSLPAVRQVRRACPDAYIAFMIAGENRALAGPGTDVDEVLAYDKKGEHKGVLRNLSFIREIRKRKFDLAIALHPSNRTHLILFASGIRRRVGYGRKLGWLLTERVPHLKQMGEKHEVDYNLDVISAAGFDTRDADREPHVPVSARALDKVKKLLSSSGISGDVMAIHAGSSCPSKKWPIERFAAVADILSGRRGVDIVMVGDGSCKGDAAQLVKLTEARVLDLTGELDLENLAAFFSLCRLVISNDSGPAHLAAAVGTPVVVIFGRDDPGLSPSRWAPVSRKAMILHSPAGCVPCLAHNCVSGFRCLANISVQDVVEASEQLLFR